MASSYIRHFGVAESRPDTADRPGKRIVVIAGKQLAAPMIRYGVGVRTGEMFHVKKVDEDWFLE